MCNVDFLHSAVLTLCGLHDPPHRIILRWCYTGRFATMIFSATKLCNIVATLFRIVPTLFQRCNAVLRLKSSLRIVSRNITCRSCPDVSVFVFESGGFFSSLAYRPHVSSENVHPKRIFSKILAFHKDGRKRGFSNTIISYIIYH